MNKQKKFQAFTLMEIIVALSISAFVFFIGYSVYDIMNKRLQNYRQSYEYVGLAQQLDVGLQNDFFTADTVKMDNRELIFYKHPDQIVKYQIRDDGIIRQVRDVYDTIKCSIMQVNAGMNQNIVNAGTINRLELKVKFKTDEYMFNYYKLYGADILMSKELN